MIKTTYPDKKVTVVDMAAAPFQHVLGADVGNAMRGMFESEGVEF